MRLHRFLFGALSAVTTLPLLAAPMSASAATRADLAPGCVVARPDAHILQDRRVDVQFYFRCNNPRIRYAKATLQIKRHRKGWADAAVKWYQFDKFRDPRQAGINGALQSSGRCGSGKQYHGDITINVMLSADQMYTHHLRGPSVVCP